MDLKVILNPSSEPSVDFVVLHGLANFRGHTTGESRSILSDASWILRQLPLEYPNCRIMIFNYTEKPPFETIFTREGARHESLRLLDCLLNLRKDETFWNKKIVFIGHDVGGVVIKEALSLAQRCLGKYESIFFATSAVVFLGCPHRFQSAEKLRTDLGKLLGTDNSMEEIREYIRELTESFPSWIAEINYAFAETKLASVSRIVNVFSTHADPLLRVFDEYTLTASLPFEVNDPIGSLTHDEIMSGDIPPEYGRKHLDFALHDYGGKRLEAPVIAQHIRELAFQVSPRFVPDVVPSHLLPPKKITDDPEFLAWKESRMLGFLLIQCQSREDATLLGGMLFRHLNDQLIGGCRVYWLHFAFLPSHCRFNTVEAMLYTFIGQIATQLYHSELGASFAEGFEEWYESHLVFGALTLEDLFAFFYGVLMFLESCGLGLGCVLSNLDKHISSYDWLMSTLSQLGDEYEVNFKVLAICSEDTQFDHQISWRRLHCSTAEDNPNNPLKTEYDDKGKDSSRDEKGNLHKASHRNGNTSRQTLDPANYSKRELGLVQLVQKHPEAYAIAPDAHGLMEACDDDKLHRVIVTWLQTRHSNLLPDNLVFTFPKFTEISPERCLETIIRSTIVPENETITSTLVLLLGAFRPLTIAELQDVWRVCSAGLTQGDNTTNRRLLSSDIAAIFGGLLEIREDEVQFTHPLLPNILSKPEGGLGYVGERVHQKVTELCLSYIVSSVGQTALKLEVGERRMRYPELRHNFLAYAVQNWPRHAKLSGTEWQLSSPHIGQFFDNYAAMGVWADQYWALVNPFSCRRVPSAHPESILARHGLDALRALLSQKRSVPPVGPRLVELLEHASRAAQRDTVQELLKLPFLENEKLDSVLLAAFQSGDELLIAELMSFASMNTEKIENPEILLRRAVSLSQVNALKKLVPIVKPGATLSFSKQGMSALQYACARGKSEAIEVILENGLVISSEDIRTSLKLACRNSNAKTIALLMDEDMKHTQLDSEGYYKDLIEATIKSGRFSNLDFILGRLESSGSIGKLDITILSQVIATKHIKCGEALMKRIKGSIEPKTPGFMVMVLEAIREEIYPLCYQLLQIEGALLDGNLATCLSYALQQESNLSVFEKILDLASKQCTDEDIISAVTECMHSAIDNRREDIVRLFIQNRAHLEDKSASGTVLYHAAYAGYVEIVPLLIDNKADVNACNDDDGWNVIHAACDNAEISRMLLNAGADINLQNRSNNTSLVLAAMWGYHETMKVLLGFKPSQKSMQQALLASAERGAVESIKLLLDAGADPRESPTKGVIELQSAIISSTPEAVRILLEFGIDLEGRESPINTTALNIATSGSNPETDLSIVKLLVNRGSDIESVDKLGDTPLCGAACREYLGIAEYLLSKGAEVNTTSNSYGSPLIQACHRSSLDMVKLLCGHGADTRTVSSSIYGVPLQSALYRDPGPEKDKIIEYLIKDAPKKADVNQKSPWWGVSLNLACLNCNISTIQLMFDNGAGSSIDEPDNMGRKPIHFALYRSKEIIKFLRGKEANLFEKDKMQRGPLHYAVLSGSLDLVLYVMDESEDPDLVNAEDVDGWTPLLWAIRRCPRWQTEEPRSFRIIKALLERGANLEAKGSGLDRTWTAMKLARFYGSSDDIINLLESGGELKESKHKPKWDITSLTTRKGQEYGDIGYCDACLTILIGVYYICDVCSGFCLCFKCYRSRDTIHSQHPFSDCGNEYTHTDEDKGDHMEDDSEYPAEGEHEDEDEIMADEQEDEIMVDDIY